jgi:hypothetical protein
MLVVGLLSTMLGTLNHSFWRNIFTLIIDIPPSYGPNITTIEDSGQDVLRKMHRVTHGQDEKGEFQEHSELEPTRHIIVFVYKSLINLLKRAGFEIEKEYGVGYYSLPPFMAHLLQRFDICHTHHLVIETRKAL